MQGTPEHTLSLNEVEQLSLKAARGAGTSWGVAEDAARAARWLAARGIDWARPILTLLEQTPPAVPLLEALAVADRLHRAAAGERWELQECAPGWLLPVLATARPTLTLRVEWPGGCARISPGGTADATSPAASLALFAPAGAVVTAHTACHALPHPLAAVTRRSSVPAETLASLEALALRTAVPASAQSRTAGAGGGRVDDD